MYMYVLLSIAAPSHIIAVQCVFCFSQECNDPDEISEWITLQPFTKCVKIRFGAIIWLGEKIKESSHPGGLLPWSYPTI